VWAVTIRVCHNHAAVSVNATNWKKRSAVHTPSQKTVTAVQRPTAQNRFTGAGRFSRDSAFRTTKKKRFGRACAKVRVLPTCTFNRKHENMLRSGVIEVDDVKRNSATK